MTTSAPARRRASTTRSTRRREPSRPNGCVDESFARGGELVATYEISQGTRQLVLYGRSSALSLWDEPSDGGEGPRYLVEQRIDRLALPWVVEDYIGQSRRRDQPAMQVPPWPVEEAEPLGSSWNAPVAVMA